LTPAVSERIDVLEKEFTKLNPDYEQVLELAKEVMTEDPALAAAVMLAAKDPNGDPVALSYKIGKMHPRYGQPAAAKSPDHKPADLKRIIDNSGKRKSSANVGGSAGGLSVEELSGMDADELSSVLARMPFTEYSKVPWKIRQKALGK
jgi:hypothetical protein